MKTKTIINPSTHKVIDIRADYSQRMHLMAEVPKHWDSKKIKEYAEHLSKENAGDFKARNVEDGDWNFVDCRVYLNNTVTQRTDTFFDQMQYNLIPYEENQ